MQKEIWLREEMGAGKNLAEWTEKQTEAHQRAEDLRRELARLERGNEFVERLVEEKGQKAGTWERYKYDKKLKEIVSKKDQGMVVSTVDAAELIKLEAMVTLSERIGRDVLESLDAVDIINEANDIINQIEKRLSSNVKEEQVYVEYFDVTLPGGPYFKNTIDGPVGTPQTRTIYVNPYRNPEGATPEEERIWDWVRRVEQNVHSGKMTHAEAFAQVPNDIRRDVEFRVIIVDEDLMASGLGGRGGGGNTGLVKQLEGQVLKTAGQNVAKEILSTQQLLQDIAKKVSQSVQGQGTVPGTLKHTEFAKQIKNLNNPLLKPEVTYKNGKIVPYGTKDGVRLDAVEYNSDGTIKAVYDLKTGYAGLTNKRTQEIQKHLPNSAPVIEIRP